MSNVIGVIFKGKRFYNDNNCRSVLIRIQPLYKAQILMTRLYLNELQMNWDDDDGELYTGAVKKMVYIDTSRYSKSG